MGMLMETELLQSLETVLATKDVDKLVVFTKELIGAIADFERCQLWMDEATRYRAKVAAVQAKLNVLVNRPSVPSKPPLPVSPNAPG